MKGNGGRPKDDMIKFVLPEAIHTLKLGIFNMPNRLNTAFRQGNNTGCQNDHD